MNLNSIVKWFDNEGNVQLDETTATQEMLQQVDPIEGLMEKTAALGVGPGSSNAERAGAAEFLLEGLYALRRISRSEERIYTAGQRQRDAGAQERDKAQERERGSRKKPWPYEIQGLKFILHGRPNVYLFAWKLHFWMLIFWN